jgi:hypothetical protein
MNHPTIGDFQVGILSLKVGYFCLLQFWGFKWLTGLAALSSGMFYSLFTLEAAALSMPAKPEKESAVYGLIATVFAILLFGSIGNDFMNPFNANSDNYQNKGNRNAFNDFGINLPADTMERFGYFADKTGRIIGNGNHRDAFNHLLHP